MFLQIQCLQLTGFHEELTTGCGFKVVPGDGKIDCYYISVADSSLPLWLGFLDAFALWS